MNIFLLYALAISAFIVIFSGLLVLVFVFAHCIIILFQKDKNSIKIMQSCNKIKSENNFLKKKNKELQDELDRVAPFLALHNYPGYKIIE